MSKVKCWLLVINAERCGIIPSCKELHLSNNSDAFAIKIYLSHYDLDGAWLCVLDSLQEAREAARLVGRQRKPFVIADVMFGDIAVIEDEKEETPRWKRDRIEGEEISEWMPLEILYP